MPSRSLAGRAGVWLVAVVASVLVMGSIGCRETPPPAVPPQPLAGQTVQVIVPREYDFQGHWEVPLNEWSAQTGGRIELTAVPYLTPLPGDPPAPWQPGRPVPRAAGNANANASAASTSAASADNASAKTTAAAADAGARLLVVPLTKAAEWQMAVPFAPIPDSLLSQTELDWNGLWQGLRDGVGQHERRPVLLPLSAPVLVLYLRSDLLQQAGLRPPETWDDYHELLRTVPQWAPGLIAVEPWSESFRGTMFLARAVSSAKHPGYYSLFFDIETGAPLIDKPGFVQALEAMSKDVKFLAQAADPKHDLWQMSPAECRHLILSGRAAMAITYEAGPASQEMAFGPGAGLTQGPPSADRPKTTRPAEISLTMVRLPGVQQMYNLSRKVWEKTPSRQVHQVPLTGFAGVGLAVTASGSAAEREAAFSLMSRLAARVQPQDFPPGTVSPTRDGDLGQPADWIGPELQPAEADQYLQVVQGSLRDQRVVAELPVPGRDRLLKSLSLAITRALRDEATPAGALEQAAEEWKSIIQEIGQDRFINSYRTSLGLPPRTPPR